MLTTITFIKQKWLAVLNGLRLIMGTYDEYTIFLYRHQFHSSNSKSSKQLKNDFYSIFETFEFITIKYLVVFSFVTSTNSHAQYCI